MKNRIKLTDNMMEMVIKMSDGNPGAVDAIMELSDVCQEIDPQSAFGPFTALISLDERGIYGTDIYILWSDKCGRDNRKMLLLLRSVQLGFLSESKLQEMGADQMNTVNLSAEEWAELEEKVLDQLEDFKR